MLKRFGWVAQRTPWVQQCEECSASTLAPRAFTVSLAFTISLLTVAVLLPDSDRLLQKGHFSMAKAIASDAKPDTATAKYHAARTRSKAGGGGRISNGAATEHGSVAGALHRKASRRPPGCESASRFAAAVALRGMRSCWAVTTGHFALVPPEQRSTGAANRGRFLLCMGLFSRFCVRALRCTAQSVIPEPRHAMHPGADTIRDDGMTSPCISPII